MTDLRSEAKKSSREISNALNNAVTPGTASTQITKLGNSLQQLAQTAKVPEKQFKITADAIAKGLKEDAIAMGLTEKQFASLNEQMLKTQAWNTAEKAMKDIARASGMTSKELNDLALQMGYTDAQALKLSRGLDKLQKEANEMNRAFDKTEADAKQTAAAFDKVRIDALRMNVAFDKAAKTAKGKLAVAFEKAQHEANKMNKKFDEARMGSAKLATSFASMRGNVLGFAFAVGTATFAVKRMSEAIWEAGINTLVAKNAYKEITGSVAKANEQFRFISKTADDLGLNFFTMREGFKGFLAAAQSSKLPMLEVQAIFRSVSNAGAILGLSNERMKLSFLALEQMMSKGKVSMEEIRRQLGDNIPGAFQLGAAAMDMTVEAFDKAVSAGEVFADDFLPKFRKALDENYTGTIDDSVRAVNKLAESWEQLKNQMADAGFMEDTAKTLKKITDIFKDEAAIKGMEKVAWLLGKILLVGADVAATPFAWIGGPGASNALVDIENSLVMQLKTLENIGAESLKQNPKYIAILANLESIRNATEDTFLDTGNWSDALDEVEKSTASLLQAWSVLDRATVATMKSNPEEYYKNWKRAYDRRLKDQENVAKQARALFRANQWIRDAEIENIKDVEKARTDSWQKDIEEMNTIIAKEEERFNAIERQNAKDRGAAEGIDDTFGVDVGKIETPAERTQREIDEAAKSLALTKATQDAKVELYKTAAGNIADTFRMISQAGGEQSKEAFMVYKAFAMVQAAIAGHQAVVGALGSPPYGIPAIINATAIGAMAAIQVGLIAGSQPPSFDGGGVSNAGGTYQTGSIREAHIPIPSGKVKVDLGSEGGTGKVVNINLNNPVFQDLETQRQVMVQIASVVAAQVAPGAVVENYRNDGPVRQMVRSGA